MTIKSGSGLTAIDFAILSGNYVMSYYLFLQKAEIQDAKFYHKENIKRKRCERYDYAKFLECLINKIHPNEAPSFVVKIKRKVFKDPCIDPREHWGKWFKRVGNFGDPPFVERE